MAYAPHIPFSVRFLKIGEVAEWPNVRDWKSRVPHKGTEGSNPSLSAIYLSSYITVFYYTFQEV